MEFSSRTCCECTHAPSVDSFKNRLDKQWSNEEILYDYKAATPAGRKLFAPAGTQDLTIEAKACAAVMIYERYIYRIFPKSRKASHGILC